jgi:alpha-beta hydrolase superfamily lysophospholipase
LRLLAERFAAAGIAALRFDYPGQGDSLDAAPDADAVPLWLDAIRAGRQRLMSELGLSRVALGGVRLGASLAYMAAEPEDPLLLLAPVVSGRSWSAKLRFAAAQGRRDAGGVVDADALDADGLVLSPATCAGLACVDLLAPGAARGPTFLALAGKAPKALTPALWARVQSLETVDFEGYDRLFVDPNDNEAPEPLFGAAVGWLSAHAPAGGAAAAPRPCGRVLQQTLVGPGWREEAVAFGDGLVGVVTSPVEDSPKTLVDAVVFLNTGGDPKAGIGRFAALAGRRLAAHGRMSLRFDFGGVGDSKEPEGVERVHVYETSRTRDLDAVHAFLKQRGVGRIFLVGVSAGGFHALWTTLRDDRFFAAYCISTIKLVWRSGDAITIGTRRWGRATGAYLADMISPKTWLRIIRGQVAIGPIASSIWARLLAALKPERRTVESRAFQRQVRAVADRGGRIGLLMGVEDAALDEVESHFGRGGRRFVRLPGMDLTVIEGLDHGLVYERSRIQALAALETWLDQA